MVRVLLFLLTVRIAFSLLLLLICGLLWVAALLLALHLSGTARHKLHASLLHIHLQQWSEFATVGKFYLLADWNAGIEYPLVILGDGCLANHVGYAHLVGRDVYNLVGEAVDADEVRAHFASVLVLKFHDLAKVAALQEVLLVIGRKSVTLVGHIELRLVAHEMRHQLKIVILILAERETCLYFKLFTAKGRFYGDKSCLAVVQQGFHILLAHTVEVNAILGTQFLQVHIILADKILLGIRSSLWLLLGCGLFCFLFHVVLCLVGLY